MPEEVATDVLVVATRIAEGKVGVIAGTRVALAVDAGIDEAEGRAVLAAAESLGREVIELVYTHGHADHALGGTVFRGRTIHAREEVAGHMRAQLPRWAEGRDEPAEQLEADLGWPTDPFTGGARLELGGRSVELIDSPGHAPGAICVVDQAAGVLFGGDTVVTAIPPAFSDGDGATLAHTLRHLAALGCEVLIPGHGAIVTGTDAVREAIEWSANYLERCIEHVERHAGNDETALLDAAPFEDYIGDHLPQDRHRMVWRHEQTLRVLRRQLEARSGGRQTRHV